MNRPWHIWTAFAVCLGVVLAALAWISVTALRLDRAEREAKRQAAIEERVQLALWRIDSALTPLIAQENARPYFTYSAFYPAERAYTRMYAEGRYGEVLVPSPLLTRPSPHVLIHFQFDPELNLSSPQVPVGNDRRLAEPKYVKPEKVQAAARRLAEVREGIAPKVVLAKLPLDSSRAPAGEWLVNRSGKSPDRQGRNQTELNVRMQQQFSNAAQMAQPMAYLPPVNLKEGVMRPMWVGDALILARRVTVDGKSFLQGCRMDWAGVREWLLGTIRDLLPSASLEPIKTEVSDQDARVLTALPVRLVPGGVSEEPATGRSPIELSLFIAWGCVVLAAGAVAALLHGAVALSERRGAFVSAVTHELRTPLTTFRLYSEMLEGGMVTDEAKRRSYLRTLCTEADRLSHLVENVLAFARLERGNARRTIETLFVHQVLDRVTPRLVDHAARGTMTLVVEASEDTKWTRVTMDTSAVEQILFNLVDNARKYAAAAVDRRLVLSAGVEGHFVTLGVRDYGPGVTARDARKLFRPFGRSGAQAANSPPGVGLGLALSRRLARELGGDLRCDPTVTEGACFVLLLKAGG